jgi:hypothetical protein
MNNESILELRKAEGDVCISILLNMNNTFPQRNQNRIMVKDAVREAKKLLPGKVKDESSVESLISKVDNLVNSISYEKIKHGIGLFISDNFEKIIYFNSAVIDKITVEKSFDIRNILFSAVNEQPYYIIILNEKYVRFLKGVQDNLVEIKNPQLPYEIKNDFQYAEIQNILSRGPEETDINAKRLAASIREAEAVIKNYIDDENAIVIVSGLNKIISIYKDITKNSYSHIHYDELSYENMSLSEIGNRAQRLVEEYHEQEALGSLTYIFENQVKYKFVSGVEDTWYESVRGKGEILFVEENLMTNGYKDKMGELFLNDHLNMQNEYTEIPDVVDDIMKNVIFTGGKVIFLLDDSLNDYGRILLTLRY